MTYTMLRLSLKESKAKPNILTLVKDVPASDNACTKARKLKHNHEKYKHLHYSQTRKAK